MYRPNLFIQEDCDYTTVTDTEMIEVSGRSVKIKFDLNVVVLSGMGNAKRATLSGPSPLLRVGTPSGFTQTYSLKFSKGSGE